MVQPKGIERIAWDSAALGCDAYEIAVAAQGAMAQPLEPGHYSVKVDPLADKRILHENGFYYCDTLIEPFCAARDLRLSRHADAGFTREGDLASLQAICRGAFRHGRFHRDFQVARAQADLRYENWLRTLHAAGRVYGLLWRDELAGFIAHEGGRLVLHALGAKHRGEGIARYLWSAVCADLVQQGLPELTSSISAANLAALNLYAGLGFRCRNPVDVYHRRVP